jgi:branched-chain amino acid transport system substrate-binding protein
MHVVTAFRRPFAVAAACVLLPVAGCSGGHEGTTAPAGARTVVIASDLPLQGGTKAMSQETNDALRLYLDQVKSRAGAFTVALRTYDNSTATRGGWDDETCVKNAHDHLNSDEVAVMGTFNSGCARLMVPVMNVGPDGPLLMVSHANSTPGLTKSWGPGEPQKFYPSATRSFARVAATDDAYSAASANFLSGTLHRKRCYVLNDGQVYGVGLARAFIAAAGEQGIRVLGNKTWDLGETDYAPLFAQVKKQHPDCVVVAGDYSNNGRQIITDKVAVLGGNARVTLMAPGFAGYGEMDALAQAKGVYLAFGGLSLQQMVARSPVAAAFVAAFKSRYSTEMTSSYTLYAVAALQVMLQAIAAGDGTRTAVNNAVFGPADLTVPAARSITGEDLTINHRTGDLTSSTITILLVRGGKETYLSSTRVS